MASAIIKKYNLLNGIQRSSCFCHMTWTKFPESTTKVFETFTEEFEIGSHVITLESGKLAPLANGAALLRMDNTNVFSAVYSGKVRDFLPLKVVYQEEQYAQGKFSTTYMQMEDAPKERELLYGHLIDRLIRPLFPAGFYHEVQVTAKVLKLDGTQDPDVMAANATSAALMLSDIPWDGPIGMIRVGRINGHLVVNPSMDELNLSDLNLLYACTRDKTLLLDVQAHEISERDLEAVFRFAHLEAVKFIEPQIRLAAKARKQKKEYKLSLVPKRTMDKIHRLAEARIEEVFTHPVYGKIKCQEALAKIGQDVQSALQEEGDEESLKFLSKAVDTVRNQVLRRKIIIEGFRLDGRRLDEIKPLNCKACGSHASESYGISLFSCRDTKVQCGVFIRTPQDAQRLDSTVYPSTKRFIIRTRFPSYYINEAGQVFVDYKTYDDSISMASVCKDLMIEAFSEKAFLAVLPSELDFPYSIHADYNVLESDGSISMATVCGGTVALMDVAVPLRKHVAGVSVGLITEVDPSTGVVDKYRILTDILGLEDHVVDMDFKIAGTRNGITAIQSDIKCAGIPLDIICESLRPAYKGRRQVLDHIEREITAPHIVVEGN